MQDGFSVSAVLSATFQNALFLPAQLINRLLQHARLGGLKHANDFDGGNVVDVLNHYADSFRKRLLVWPSPGKFI